MKIKNIGKYEIEGFLGKGAMGKVYRARDKMADRVVAIKTILIDDLDSEKEREAFLSRFQQEIRISARLIHPNIVILFDTGTQEGTPYIVMEYVEGTTLSRMLADQSRLPFEKVLKLTSQIASALDFAHSHKIVHRDIKPENIMVTKSGDAKLTDFGVAKVLDPQKTRSVGFMGTPRYASPEQIRDADIDHRSDIFTFGIVVHELLTGFSPFAGSSIQSILFKIASAQADLADPFPDYGLNAAEVRQLFRKVLNVSPAERFESATAFSDAVAALSVAPRPTATMALPLLDIRETMELPRADQENLTKTSMPRDESWRKETAELPNRPPRPEPPAPQPIEPPGTVGEQTDSGWEYKPGQRIGDRFTVIVPLSKGPLGPLYKVSKTDGEIEVLRVVEPALVQDEASRIAFADDLEEYKSLRHPHLLPITHLERLDTFNYHRIFYTLPFVDGGSIKERLDQNQEQDEQQVFDWLEQLASCLEYLHGKSIVHRNIHPGNLYVGSNGNLRLGEPGLALRFVSGPLKHALTNSLNERGAHYFLPPEEQEALFLGRDPDLAPARDVCAFGLTAYALLTGRAPADNSAPLTTIMKNRAFALRLDPFLNKCRARNPHDRFRDAGHMAAALFRILHRSGAPAGAPTPFQAFDPSKLGDSQANESAAGSLGEETTPPPVVFSPSDLTPEPPPAKEPPTAPSPVNKPISTPQPAPASPSSKTGTRSSPAKRPVAPTKSAKSKGGNKFIPIALIAAVVLGALLGWFFLGSSDDKDPGTTQPRDAEVADTNLPEPPVSGNELVADSDAKSEEDVGNVLGDQSSTEENRPSDGEGVGSDQDEKEPIDTDTVAENIEDTPQPESEPPKPSPEEIQRRRRIQTLTADFRQSIETSDILTARESLASLNQLGARSRNRTQRLASLEETKKAELNDGFSRAEAADNIAGMRQLLSDYANLWSDEETITSWQSRALAVESKGKRDNLMARFEAALISRERDEAVAILAELEGLGVDVDASRSRLNEALPAAPRVGDERIFMVGGERLALVWIPPGSFTMGSSTSEDGHKNDEYLHPVDITRGFWMARTETTQELYRIVMGDNPSAYKKNRHPVESVSWRSAQDFIKRLNSQIEGGTFRLPTEAEWEYSCRAGTRTAYAGQIDDMGWHKNNSNGHPWAVAQKQPNPWGLYDMHGNVLEWTEDRYGERYFLEGPRKDPPGPTFGSARVHRGGCFEFTAKDCRSASRFSRSAKYRGKNVGFRLVYQDN